MESVELRIYVLVLVFRCFEVLLQVVVYWPESVIIIKARMQPCSLIEVSIDSG